MDIKKERKLKCSFQNQEKWKYSHIIFKGNFRSNIKRFEEIHGPNVFNCFHENR